MNIWRGWGRGILGSTRPDRGSAVLETALMIPVLVALTVLLLTCVQVGMTALHLTDTAHDLARGLARGITVEEIQSQAATQAPAAQLLLTNTERMVTVTLRQDVSVPVPMFSQLSFALERSVSAPLEVM